MASKAKKMFVWRWMSGVYGRFETATNLAEATSEKFSCVDSEGIIESWVFDYAHKFFQTPVFEDD